MTRQLSTLVALLLLVSVSPKPLSAATVLFFDDFDRSVSNTVGTPTTGGGDWWESDFGGASKVKIVNGGVTDHALRISSPSSFGGVQAARQLDISTAGYNNIRLSFDWKPLLASDTTIDTLTAAFRVSDGNTILPLFSSNPVGTYGLGDNSGAWNSVTDFALPNSVADLAGSDRLQLQFGILVAGTFNSRGRLVDSASNEGALIDNIRVTGDEILGVGIESVGAPEPASLAVWSLLAAVAVGWRRRMPA